MLNLTDIDNEPGNEACRKNIFLKYRIVQVQETLRPVLEQPSASSLPLSAWL
jgi:hypothetical protein